ncbi:MAG: hypothetical protein JWP32_1334 [Schumannella sp.]|nr:hypothetical protein [Schumannella sp.]
MAERAKKRTSSSPYSTGGGGVTFERRVAVGYLAALATGATIAGINGTRVVEVAFQQAPLDAVDDLLVTTQPDGPSRARLTYAVGVRRRPALTRTDRDTEKLLADYLTPAVGNEEHEYGLVVAGTQTAATQLAALAALARTTTRDAFFPLVGEPGRFQRAVRSRLDHLRDLVAGALASLGLPHSDDEVATATWTLLSRLTVLQPRYEEPDTSDWDQLLNSLQDVASNRDLAGARALRDRLEALAGTYAPQGATIDRSILLRDVHDLLATDLTPNDPGWAALQALDAGARATIRNTIGQSPDSAGLHLDRHDTLSALRKRLSEDGVLLVHGPSGVGKSALILAAIDGDIAAGETEALYLNLRQLPDSGLILDGLLGRPLRDLLRLMTAPRRWVVIDGADYLTESAQTAFGAVVQAARDAEVELVVVATDDAVQAVTADLGPTSTVIPVLIPGLDDDDLGRVSESNPGLSALFSTGRSKDLMRRPVIADLLVRANSSVEAVTEADAMAEVWRGLVRRHERGDRGAPDARDQTLRLLAEHALGRATDDQTLSRLDLGVVDRLRRDGILAPASATPWKRVPEFAHDQLRLYAVSQVLLAHADPAAELRADSAPRWTLPAARLAAQYLLAADDSAENPLADRFERLQASFDELSAAGSGERWADVPTEAILPLPASQQLLVPAWASLQADDGAGLRRIFRLIQQRHVVRAFVVERVAAPVVAALLSEGWPSGLHKEVAELIRSWLQALVIAGAPAGQPLRLLLRDRIVARVDAADAAAVESARATAAALAARTPEEIAEEEERRSRLPILSGPIGFERRRRGKARAYLPRELTDDTVVEQLGLLGPDLGTAGEGLLRRIAENAPWSLEHAVETPVAGRAIASYRPAFLVEIAEAYYIDDVHPEDDDFGWDEHEEGVRDHGHGSWGLPFSSPYRGPFLVMFQTDFRGGVSFLIRMLNHAALCRVKSFRGYRDEGDPVERNSVTLSVSGSPRRYIGDANVWLWYRGGGVGPYPCMSALQALELAVDQFIAAKVPVNRIVKLLMPDCENLAMPALVVGILERHLEQAGDLLDRYLSEPEIWHLEFGRMIQERSGMVGKSEGIAEPERRLWTFREAAMMLALRADPERIAELDAVADLLEQRARDEFEVDDADLDRASREYLASVTGWASSLRRDTWQTTATDGGVIIEGTVPDAVEQILQPGRDQSQLSSHAYGLINRYDFARHSLAGPPMVDQSQLITDVGLARKIAEAEEFDELVGVQAVAAVACTLVERRYRRDTAVDLDDLTWAGQVLLEVAEAYAIRPASDAWSFSYFAHDADISASRSVALLLAPEAGQLVGELADSPAEALTRVMSANRWAATHASLDDRMAWARSLDAIWSQEPVELPDGKNSHDFLIGLIETSLRGCVLGPWSGKTQRRRAGRLNGPLLAHLASVDPKLVVSERLLPGIRALHVLATQAGERGERANLLLVQLLRTYTAARLSHDHTPQHSRTDMVTVARALLTLHENGQPEMLSQQLEAVIDRNDLLDEFMDALGAVGEENAWAGSIVAEVWPLLMDQALDLMDRGRSPMGDGFLAARGIASLIPNPTYDNQFLVRELDSTPMVWIEFGSIAPHVARWVPYAAGHRECVDQLVGMLRLATADEQVVLGVPWMEALVAANPAAIAGYTYLLSSWLHDIAPTARSSMENAAWQRIVDQLLVAGEERVADLAD